MMYPNYPKAIYDHVYNLIDEKSKLDHDGYYNLDLTDLNKKDTDNLIDVITEEAQDLISDYSYVFVENKIRESFIGMLKEESNHSAFSFIEAYRETMRKELSIYMEGLIEEVVKDYNRDYRISCCSNY